MTTPEFQITPAVDVAVHFTTNRGQIMVKVPREHLVPGLLLQTFGLTIDGQYVVRLSLHTHDDGGSLHTICDRDTNEVRQLGW